MLTCSKFFAILIFFFGWAVSAPAQDAKAPPANADNNQRAHALLVAASKVNGLTGDDVKPWHLKGKDTYYGYDSNKPELASIEEWSAARYRWRISYVSKRSTATVWSVSRAHELKAKKDDLRDWEPITDPIAVATIIKPDYELNLMHLNLSVPLDCVSVVHPERYKKPISQHFFPVLCFDEKLRLRLESEGDYVAEYDDYQVFQHHSVPGYIKAAYAGKVLWEFRQTALEPLVPVDEVLLTPGKDAVPVPHRLDLDDPRPVPVHREAGPTYLQAQEIHKGQLLWIPIVIQKDGSVRVQRDQGVGINRGADTELNRDYIHFGTTRGIPAIFDAAEQWTFEPYIVDGEAIEVALSLPFTEDGQPWGQW